MQTIGIRYTQSEISKIRHSNFIVATVHQKLKELIQVGITTEELDREAETVIEQLGGKPAFKGYKGFPYATCISVNDTIVHGFPSKYLLKEGDLVSVDVGAVKSGHFGDSCFSVVVGENDEALRLVASAYDCLFSAISILKDGVTTGDIGSVIESTASNSGYDVVRDFVGHGIGCILHDLPHIKNYGKPKFGFTLKEGMVICIEPMLTIGSAESYKDKNGWEVRTKDGKLAAHVEHCVLITKNGYEILSLVP